MNPTTLRPDDGELVRQATRTLRAATGADVVFAGLRGERGIRISSYSGAWSDRLGSIEVQPARGLGGVSWETRRAILVDDYRGARTITHHFDPQILGEGIQSLAVAPIVVGRHVRGLLYAGNRETAASEIRPGELVRAASLVAEELRIRDLVDERLEIKVRQTAAGVPDQLRSQLRQVAAETQDPETARRLVELLGGMPGAEPAVSSPDGGLTRRQQDVLGLVAYGLTNAQIATRLGISEVTVKSYLRTIMSRFSVRTRSRAVIEARRLGLLPAWPND